MVKLPRPFAKLLQTTKTVFSLVHHSTRDRTAAYVIQFVLTRQQRSSPLLHKKKKTIMAGDRTVALFPPHCGFHLYVPVCHVGPNLLTLIDEDDELNLQPTGSHLRDRSQPSCMLR